MVGYNDDDRRAAIELEGKIEQMRQRMAALERGQRISLRRMRRLPDLTATAIVKAVGKKALFLIGAGIALGSALGGAGIALVQRIALWIMKTG